MATLEPATLTFFHPCSSPNSPLLFPTRLHFPISNLTPKLFFKSPLSPLPLPISRKFHVCLSSSSAIQEISVEEEEEKLEETHNENQRRKLYVLNLPWSFSVADLKNLFGDCGTVADVEIIKREDGKSRGFAFITMSSGEEALAVIKKFDSYELSGRIIKVEFAKKFKKPSPPARETRHKLYVSNLAWKVRATHLREFFSVDFNPISTRVVFNNSSGKSAGFGFVGFASKDEAESAISALDGKELFGRAISLKFSERSPNKSETNEENTQDEPPADS